MDSAVFDTYLYLVNSAGQVVASDDDSGPGLNALIPSTGFLTLPATGTYTIEATSASAGATGA